MIFKYLLGFSINNILICSSLIPLFFISGKKDLVTFAGPYLPENIEIPENISLEMAFKGKIKEFATTANMTSSFGAANLIASIDPAENFSGKVTMSNLDVAL